MAMFTATVPVDRMFLLGWEGQQRDDQNDTRNDEHSYP
jgi:hypothetical protein